MIFLKDRGKAAGLFFDLLLDLISLLIALSASWWSLASLKLSDDAKRVKQRARSSLVTNVSFIVSFFWSPPLQMTWMHVETTCINSLRKYVDGKIEVQIWLGFLFCRNIPQSHRLYMWSILEPTQEIRTGRLAL